MKEKNKKRLGGREEREEKGDNNVARKKSLPVPGSSEPKRTFWRKMGELTPTLLTQISNAGDDIGGPKPLAPIDPRG